jgi:beta-N-acetylhexosaminidase
MSRGIRSLALLTALLLIAAEQKAEPEPPKPAPPGADVRGEVKNLKLLPAKARGTVGTLLVVGVKEKDTSHDRAMVRLQADTKVYRWAEGKKKDAKVEDLKAGQKVQCVFTGPVAESYPVQATGKEVLILEEPKK